MMMQKSPVLEEEEQISEEQQDQDSGNNTVQEDNDENSEEDELVLNDEDLLTQQNNQIQQHEYNDIQEDEPNHDLQDATTPGVDNEQEEDLEEDSEEDDVHSSKLTSPIISTNHHMHEIDEQQQDNTTTAVAAINSSHSEESIQIDEEDLENVRREETMEESGLVYDEEMDYLLNEDKIMMPQTPLLVNNESFTTPNSAGSVNVAMPFLEDMEESPKPVLLNNIESKVDECNITVTREDVSKEELVTSPVHQQMQPIVNSNIETLSENHPMIDSIQDDEQMNVIVMEDDQVINQEVEKTSLVQQQETNNVNNNDIMLSINLDEDLDIDMINDFLQSEKGTDLCEAHSKENSPHCGDSLSNQSVNDSWNTNYTIESSNAPHYRQQSTTTPLLYRKSTSITQGIPLEVLLTNYDHRIEFSTLEMLVKELEGIGVHTINYLLLIPKKQIMALPGMDDKLYENLMDSAQSLDPSQSFGFSTATQFLHEFHTKRYKVTTGCTAFDELIGGGFESSSVSELFSESGCGKTQVCFTLCLTAQLPLTEDGPSGKVLFVDTMGTFNPNRIKSIAERFAKDDERMTTLFMNNILKERIYTSEQLFANLSRITTLLKNNKGKPVKMIIVDSAVNLFRSEYKGKDEITVRQQYLLKYLDSLNKLAEQFNIAVVITNQVMDSFDKPSLLYSPYKQNNSPSIKPVGGHILAHTIPTRIQLAREKQKRIARVFKSSTRPEGSCNFSIRATGISDYEEE